MTFERTTCACPTCVQCCKDQPGPLAPGDLQAIAEYLRKPVRAILDRFWASPGAIVRERSGRLTRVATITPRSRRGRCVFLDAGDRCTIHPVAPFGCAYFDTHQTPDQYLLAIPLEQWPQHQDTIEALQLSAKYNTQVLRPKDPEPK